MKHNKSKETESLYRYHSDQSWSCTGCGKCCTMWDIPVTRLEKERIEKLIIPGFDLINEEHFIQNKKHPHLFLIKKKKDQCIFLDDNDKLCTIHKQHGERVKPLACRLYPFHILKWKDNITSVSLRFDCKGVSENIGKKISEHKKEIVGFSKELSSSGRPSNTIYNRQLKPELKRLRIVAQAYKKLLFHKDISTVNGLHLAARLLDFHAEKENHHFILEADSSFINDSLAYLEENHESFEALIAEAPPVDKLLNMVFNYIITGYARVDEETRSIGFFSGRIKRAKSILKFMINRGSLNELGNEYPETYGLIASQTLKDVNLSDESEVILKRYMGIKLESMHFCGNPGLNLSFEEGMKHLLVIYPITVAIASLKSASEKRDQIDETDIIYSIRITDHTFYHSPFFNLFHVKRMIKWLTSEKIFPSVLKMISN